MQDYTYRFVTSLTGLLLLITTFLSNTSDTRHERTTPVGEPQRVETDR
jgi:hypothetical protein